MINQIIQGDCLELMKDIENESIDMILSDLPYGKTHLEWDSIIPLEPMWEQFKRIIKDKSAIVLTARQPFTTTLISSNKEMFKYTIIWQKQHCNFVHAKNRPLNVHEDIVVFSKGNICHESQSEENRMNYFPIGVRKRRKKATFSERKKNELSCQLRPSHKNPNRNQYSNYPNTILKFKRERPTIHPTQKPVKLFEYLIKMYTQKDDLVLDCCSGSGTTAIACINTDRKYFGIELNEEFHRLATERVQKHTRKRGGNLADYY